MVSLIALFAASQVLVSTPDVKAVDAQLAIDSKGVVHLVYGAAQSVFYASSKDKGLSFSTPVKVGEAGRLSLGMRRGPRVAASKDRIVVSAIYGERGGGRDGDLVAWSSLDGTTWDGPVKVSDTPGSAREGLHAMAGSPGGDVACAWLDMRGTGTEVFLSISKDGGRTWSTNTSAYKSPEKTVCECCSPSIAYGPKGELYIMFRNALAGARDMFLTKSTDGGNLFAEVVKLGEGTWPLKACPMDGGMLAIAPDGSVHSVWRRGTELFDSRPGHTELLLGTGDQPWIAWTRAGLARVWHSKGQVVGQVGARKPEVLATDGKDPVICSASAGDFAVAAWHDAKGQVWARQIVP